MEQLKWGIIGSVNRANAFITDINYTCKPHELHAFLLADIEADIDMLSIPVDNVFADMQKFLESEIDAVYIASPYKDHFLQVKACLKNKKAVLCEKPIAENSKQLKQLIKLSEQNNTFMMEGMWIRFLPSIKKVLSIINSGAIGEVTSIKATLTYKQTDADKRLNSGGGALFELGIYPIFLCTLLLGTPVYVQATGKLSETGEDDICSAFLSYDEGKFGFIETSRLTRGDSVATITGEKGFIKIKNPWSIKPEGIEVDFSDGSKVLHKSEWEGRGLQFELDEVFDCVASGETESQLYEHKFSLDVLRTIDDIRKQL
jgi:predicted dehydrogenase